jgi:hypothetical protein
MLKSVPVSGWYRPRVWDQPSVPSKFTASEMDWFNSFIGFMARLVGFAGLVLFDGFMIFAGLLWLAEIVLFGGMLVVLLAFSNAPDTREARPQSSEQAGGRFPHAGESAGSLDDRNREISPAGPTPDQSEYAKLPRYTYEPIPTQNWIRILDLHPGFGNEGVICTLRSVPREFTTYDALSWC